MATLVQYNLTSDFNPTTQDAAVTGSTITNESLATFTRGNAGYASDPVSSAGPASGATSAALARTNNSDFYFSITPISGKKFSLTNLTINMARGGAATPRGYDIRSSIDSYAASLGTADLATQRTTWTAVDINLTGSEFQNLTGSITFKIYVYAPSTANVIDWDALTVNGTPADTGTIEQEGYRWRNDDGSEITATWVAAQDTTMIAPTLVNRRCRFITNFTNTPTGFAPQFEFRKVGDSTWTVLAP